MAGDQAVIAPSTGVGGFTFGEAVKGGKSDAWVMTLPPELQRAFEQIENATPEQKAQMGEALVNTGLKQFDEAAAAAKLSPEQAALWRGAVEDALRGMSGTSFANKLSTEKIANMSIEDLMFYVMSERTKQLDQQIRGFAGEIQNRNNLMKHANDMLSNSRNIYAGLKEGESAMMPPDMVKFFNDNGVEIPENDTLSADGAKIEPQTKIDDANQALTDLSNMGYIDHAAVQKDVPESVMNFCAKYGIEVPDNGKSYNIGDRSTLEGKINAFKAKANAEKTHAANAPAGAEAPVSALSLTREEWDASIQSMKGFLEGLNNDSELDMIKYQSVMSKYTSGIEMLSNTMKKLADNKQAVVRNMG